MKLYPLEKMLRNLAKAKGSFVMALFDCSREKAAGVAVKGADYEEEDSNKFDEKLKHSNFMFTYSCPPTKAPKTKTTIAKAYMKYLKKSSNKEGFIQLPGPLNFFVGTDGKCNHSIKSSKALLLHWTAQKKKPSK